MRDHRNLLILFAVLIQHLLHFPHPHPQLLRRFVNHLRLQQFQQFLLLLLITHLALLRQVRIACALEMVAEDLYEPQLRVIFHEAEIKLRKSLHFLLYMSADIAGEPENLSKQRMHFHLNVPSLEDLMTGLESSLMRGDQNDLNLLILQGLPRLFTLLYALGGNPAVDVLPGIGYFLVEIIDLHALVPAEVLEVVEGLVAEETFVEIGLGVTDEDELGRRTRGVYLFQHL